MSKYVVNTKEQQQEMLKEINKNSIDELFHSIPDDIKLKQALNIPSGISEFEAYQIMESFANQTKQYQMIFRGAGSYQHYIPSVVTHVASREEFVTAYTPYQAEISQGILQSIFEYQTMICELTGMDVSNASVYDGASATAEAINMCLSPKKRTVLYASSLHPETIETIHTYYRYLDVSLVAISSKDGLIDTTELANLITEDVACFIMQTPNYFGCLENGTKIKEILNDIPFVVVVNPISLGILEAPRNYGADIVVGEGQPLGMSISFGGPYLGFMTATQQFARKLPGRIVGQTVDTRGQRAYTLTLQAREQHIRREKASSSICSNQAHCALTSAIYMASLGPKGLEDVSMQSYQHAHYLQQQLETLGFKLAYPSHFYHEFLTLSPIDVDQLLKHLDQHHILGGLKVEDNQILWCATEVNTKTQIDTLIEVIKEVLHG